MFLLTLWGRKGRSIGPAATSQNPDWTRNGRSVGRKKHELSVCWPISIIYIFIHSRPSGSNDTMQVTRKGSIRNRLLNRQRILEHNHTVCGTAFSSASRPVCCWGVVLSHKVRRHYDTERTSRRTATLRPQYKRANDPRHPVCPASERPATQSARNNASLGAPGCRIPRLRLNAQFTTLCNAVVVQEACVSVVGVHRSVTTYRIIDPQPNFSRNCRWRIATSFFNHSTCHYIVHTACVMLSTDNICRESHAAARDILQPLPTQNRSGAFFHSPYILQHQSWRLPCGECEFSVFCESWKLPTVHHTSLWVTSIQMKVQVRLILL